MKKKLVQVGIVLLTAMFVLGITACPNDSSPGSSDITISFELGSAGGTAVTGTPPANQTIKKGGTLKTVPPAPTAPTGYVFTEWVKKDTTDKVDATTTFDKNTVVVATWAVYNADEDANIDFYTGYGTGDGTLHKRVTLSGAKKAGGARALTTAEWSSIGVPTRTDYTFSKWIIKGTTTEVTQANSFYTDTIVIAQWTYSGSATDNANLSSLSVNGVSVTDLGTPASTYAAATAGSVIVLTATGTTIATAEDSDASVDLAQFVGTAYDEDDFWIEGDFTFNETGDFLAVRVIAKDGTTKQYYKIAVTVADVSLTTLTVDSVNVGSPIPATSWQTATAISYLFGYPISDQDSSGLAVVATPHNTNATIEYGHGIGGAEPIFTATDTIFFANGEFLYVRVTVSGISAYYKVRINFQMEGKIKYGSPTINNNSIDPLWEDPTLDVYLIEKVANESSGPYKENPTTTGRAKALWDEHGLYLYVDVTDPAVSTTDNEHESDSVELFLNEAFPDTRYSVGGSQYRVAANGQLSGENPDNSITPWKNWVAAEKTEGREKISVWKTSTGYITIFQVPWRLRGQFPYTANRKIGFEIQINAAPETGTRQGVVVWNNTDHTNYQNATDYGIAELSAPSTPLNFPAAPPKIDTQPVNAGIVAPGDPVSFTVAASMVAGNESDSLGIQWYSADVATVTVPGTAILGANSGTYSFSAPTDPGNYYYYAVITNSLNGTTATATSTRVVVIVATTPQVQKITLGNGSYAGYKFTLKDGWDSYARITATYLVESDQLSKGIRHRLMGNYTATDISENDGQLPLGSFNAPYIIDNYSGSYNWSSSMKNPAGASINVVAGKWFVVSYDISGDKGHGDFDDDNVPTTAAEDDDLYFALGITGSDGSTSVVQLIKEVVLVHKTDAAKNVVATMPVFWIGYGAGDHAIQSIDNPTFGVPVEVTASATGTLFNAVSDYAGAAVYNYEGNDYWIIGDTRSGHDAWIDDPTAPFDATSAGVIEELQKTYGTLGGYTRLGYSFDDATVEWKDFISVTITYDVVLVAGPSTGVQFRNSPVAGGGSDIPTSGYLGATNGTGQTITFTTTQTSNGGIGIVKSNDGGLLLRITKIELHN